MIKNISKLAMAFVFSSGVVSAAKAEIKNYVEPIEPEDCTTHLASGEASWYGDEVAIGYDNHGNPIFKALPSKEVFNPDLLTAAYPVDGYLGKYFLVKGLGKEVIVRVNDFGPSRKNPNTKDRIIDLAEAPAKRLGMDGVAQVDVYLCKI